MVCTVSIKLIRQQGSIQHYNTTTLRKNIIIGHTRFDCIKQHFGYSGIETSVLNGCFMK